MILNPWPCFLHPYLLIGREVNETLCSSKRGVDVYSSGDVYLSWGEGSVTGLMLLRWLKAKNCECVKQQKQLLNTQKTHPKGGSTGKLCCVVFKN